MSVSSPNVPTPTGSAFAAGLVTDPNQSELTRQGFFDSLLYPEAGSLLLNFFATQQGQGVTTEPGATVGTPKTYFDTNLQLANTIPVGKSYQPQMFEVYFWPGSSAATNNFTLTNPSFFNAAASQAVADQAADVYTFYSAGNFQFFILDKVYVNESPLANFPIQAGVCLDAAIASNSATTAEVGLVVARCTGRAYRFNIPMTLQAQMNFGVNLAWAGLLAMPSGFNGRVKVRMDGYFLRSTQ